MNEEKEFHPCLLKVGIRDYEVFFFFFRCKPTGIIIVSAFVFLHWLMPPSAACIFHRQWLKLTGLQMQHACSWGGPSTPLQLTPSRCFCVSHPHLPQQPCQMLEHIYTGLQRSPDVGWVGHFFSRANSRFILSGFYRQSQRGKVGLREMVLQSI